VLSTQTTELHPQPSYEIFEVLKNDFLGWRHSLSSRAPTQQVQSSEFKTLVLLKNLQITVFITYVNKMDLKMLLAGHQWLMRLILATLEGEIRKIRVRSQPGQQKQNTPQKTYHQKRADRVVQVVRAPA
jgi:hypothetical protein